MARSQSKPSWPERRCGYCGNQFKKPPKYATCGHPRCTKMHRHQGSRPATTGLPTWTPPDIYAADNAAREKVWEYLSKVDSDVLDFRLVEVIAVRTKLKPAEVIEIWKSVKKERAHAGR